ncbi:MAG: substrate-binding domain-containing protein [Alkalispirochaeta sp.]
MRTRTISSTVVLVCLQLFVLLVLSACVPSERADSASLSSRTIVFVPAVEDPFYRAIGSGARDAAEEVGVPYSEASYPEVWSADAQRDVLREVDFTDVDILLIGPVSTVALNDELREIHDSGVSIITVDTYIGDGDYTQGDDSFALTFVGSDNWNGGKEVAERLAELVGKEGAVYVSTTHSDVSSVRDRVNGFIAGTAEFPHLHVIATDYNQDRQSVAYTQTLSRLQEHPEVRAIFATNLFSAQGAYQAVVESGLTGAVRIASWDSTAPIMSALRRGSMDIVFSQTPREIGSKAVELAVDHLQGRSVTRRVLVGGQILTQETIDDVDLESLTY